MSKQMISKVLWLGFGILMTLPFLAFGEEGGEISEEARRYMADADMKKWLGLAAGLAMGIAAFGGALGQGRTASAALDGIARNPNASDKLFTPMILGLALIESLVLFGLLIAYLLISRLG